MVKSLMVEGKHIRVVSHTIVLEEKVVGMACAYTAQGAKSIKKIICLMNVYQGDEPVIHVQIGYWSGNKNGSDGRNIDEFHGVHG